MYDEVASAYEQNIEFTVGIAGTGKSTRLAELASKRTSLVLTPTHKAKNVLEAKGVKNVFTIHSVLKLVPTLNQNFRRGQKLQTLKRMGELSLEDVELVIIDEFSMINTHILDLLLAVLPSTCNVHIFGDAMQLPPVDGDAIDPLDYADEKNITVLRKQHRADNMNIVNSFMRFAKWIEDGSEKDLTLDNLPKITEKELAKRFNPKTDRIIAFTNKRVIELNSLIETPDLKAGDDILLNGLEATVVTQGHRRDLANIFPAMISKGELKLELRDDIEESLTKYGGWDVIDSFDKLVVDIDGSKYNIWYDLEHYHNHNSLEQEVTEAQLAVIDGNNLDDDVNLPKWCRANQSAYGVRRRGQAWQEYISHSSNIFDLRYPFATTVHKAQGMEFDTVYIDQENMKKAVRNNYIEQYARLMYVALSRAIKNVYIIVKD